MLDQAGMARLGDWYSAERNVYIRKTSHYLTNFSALTQSYQLLSQLRNLEKNIFYESNQIKVRQDEVRDERAKRRLKCQARKKYEKSD